MQETLSTRRDSRDICWKHEWWPVVVFVLFCLCLCVVVVLVLFFCFVFFTKKGFL